MDHDRPSLIRHDVLLPENLEDLIPNSLIPSGMPGGQTEKYFVRGYPELLVRHNKGGEPARVLYETAEVYNNDLHEFGINALPYIPIESEGKPYVVTLGVLGESLDSILARGEGGMLYDTIDQNWANLSNYLETRRRDKRPYAMDITNPGQYMYAKVAREDEDRLWLVDLGEYTDIFEGKMIPFYEYEGSILILTNTVVSIEASLGRELPRTRRQLEAAFSMMNDPRLITAAYDALDSGSPMRLDDEMKHFKMPPGNLGTQR